jgi:large subunit ribosomal protein L29
VLSNGYTGGGDLINCSGLPAQGLTLKIKAMAKNIEFNSSLKDLNEADLKARIQEDELRLKKLEFAHAISPLENPMSIRNLRKDIARLKTELKKRELAK